MARLTFHILRNGTPIKTISAAGMNSIYTQYNSYAKKRGSTLEESEYAPGGAVWRLPDDALLVLEKIHD